MGLSFLLFSFKSKNNFSLLCQKQKEQWLHGNPEAVMQGTRAVGLEVH